MLQYVSYCGVVPRAYLHIVFIFGGVFISAKDKKLGIDLDGLDLARL